MHQNIKASIEDFFFEEMSTYTPNSKKAHRTAINNFFSIIRNNNSGFTKRDILVYLNSKEFNELNPSTQNTYKRHLKKFFRWYGIDDVFLDKIKKRREKLKEFRKEDLVSFRDIRKMLKNTDNSQYKCLTILTYESAGRIDEIRNIRIKDISHYESYASIFLYISKTIARPIPIVFSIPYLSQWLNNHPERDNPNAYLFVRLYKGKYGQYTTTGLHLIIKNIAKCINKNIYPHLFRHSRLTELAKHLTEAELCKFAGWVIGSKQARRYVHLAHEDVENKILSIHGIKKPKEIKPTEIIKTIKCPVCTYENSNIDKYCSRCGSVLDIKTVIKHQQKAKELEEIINASEIKQYIDKLFDEKVFKILNKEKN